MARKKKYLLFDFNKQLAFGECGAMVAAPTVSATVARFTQSADVISMSAVIGAIVGGAIFWIFTRIYDHVKHEPFSAKKLANDMAYFTPAAFLLTLFVYYPALFFLSKYFLSQDNPVFYAVLGSQFIAFALFVVAINVYRHFLFKIIGKRL